MELLLPWVESLDINCSDKLGVTALMAALDNDQYEVAGELLDHPDIDLTVRDDEGNTVLNYVLRSNYLFYLDEILSSLRNSLSKKEIMTALLKKIIICLKDWKRCKTKFSLILDHYDVSFRNGVLLDYILKVPKIENIFDILKEMKVRCPDLKFKTSNVDNIIAMVDTGYGGLIDADMLDIKEICLKLREKKVSE